MGWRARKGVTASGARDGRGWMRGRFDGSAPWIRRGCVCHVSAHEADVFAVGRLRLSTEAERVGAAGGADARVAAANVDQLAFGRPRARVSAAAAGAGR